MAASPAAELREQGASLGRFESAFVPALILASLLASLVAPLPLLVLGPLALGVPHLIGDLRVLWLQRPSGIDDRVVWRALSPLIVMTALRVAVPFGVAAPAWLEVALGTIAVGIGAHAGCAQPSARMRAIAATILAGAVLCSFPFATTIGLAHAHNVVAFGFWVAWAGRRRAKWGAAACYVVAWCAALQWPIGAHEEAFGMNSVRAASALAPGMNGLAADAVVRSFVFAQLVHYGLWARALPRVNAHREASPPDRALVTVAILACAMVPIAGAFDPLGVRDSYLSLSVFHGWFELSVAAFLIARRASGAPR